MAENVLGLSEALRAFDCYSKGEIEF